MTGGIEIRGPRLLLRALQASEIDGEWQAMVDADPMVIPELPDEEAFRARLRRSGRLVDGQLDLAIDLDGTLIGRIQTFVPPGRPLPSGTFEVGIGLREHARGQGHGREALALLTGWLFEHAAAQVVESETDPANAAMRAVFDRVGWAQAGSQTGFGREWAVYRITRKDWLAIRSARMPGEPGTGPAVQVPRRERAAAQDERQVLGLAGHRHPRPERPVQILGVQGDPGQVGPEELL